jgi:hypothetical protein
MEQAGDQRGAQDVAYLLAAHTGLQGLDLLTRNEIALHHIHFVGCHDAGNARTRTVEAATGSQAGTEQQDRPRRAL